MSVSETTLKTSSNAILSSNIILISALEGIQCFGRHSMLWKAFNAFGETVAKSAANVQSIQYYTIFTINNSSLLVS
jgi:hypothetical protein